MVCAAQLLDAVRGNQRCVALLPVVVLVAQEAAILRLPDSGRLPVVALLAGLDARDQHIGRFLAAGGLGVARLAFDAGVRVVAEDRVRQPDRLDVGGRDRGQPGETLPTMKACTTWGVSCGTDSAK